MAGEIFYPAASVLNTPTFLASPPVRADFSSSNTARSSGVGYLFASRIDPLGLRAPRSKKSLGRWRRLDIFSPR
jgi:hypothetical protein